MPHPEFPRSNVAKFSGFDPDKYELAEVSPTVGTDESLTPCQPTRLTQRTINKFLKPLTKVLDEVPPRPTINELPDAVIDKMVQKDKAFWVDKPGANAYTLHDAYYNYGMTTEKVMPTHQDVLPRSYQYDLDCVKYRHQHACDGLKQTDNIQYTQITHILWENCVPHAAHFSKLVESVVVAQQLRTKQSRKGEKHKKPLAAHCRTCKTVTIKENKYEATSDSSQKRWRYYPDLTTALTPEKMRHMMDHVGRPFKNEACNWYYENYPPVKYNCIMRKFSK